MAQNVTEMFRAMVPSVGLVLKARADIDGKQNAYRRRIAEDAEGDESAALTEYSANADCTFNFAGGDAEKDMPFVADGDAIKALPVFFETRYFFRGDFKPVDERKVKDMLFLVSSRRGKTIVSPGGQPSFDMLPEVQHG